MINERNKYFIRIPKQYAREILNGFVLMDKDPYKRKVTYDFGYYNTETCFASDDKELLERFDKEIRCPA